jgi:hypothetical protein
MFFKGSRYAAVPDNQIVGPKGAPVRYKTTRFIGPSTPLTTYIVSRGDRLDLLANTFYRDPEQFWQIADANVALWPDDLLAVPGRQIIIPTSED